MDVDPWQNDATVLGLRHVTALAFAQPSTLCIGCQDGRLVQLDAAAPGASVAPTKEAKCDSWIVAIHPIYTSTKLPNNIHVGLVVTDTTRVTWCDTRLHVLAMTKPVSQRITALCVAQDQVGMSGLVAGDVTGSLMACTFDLCPASLGGGAAGGEGSGWRLLIRPPGNKIMCAISICLADGPADTWSLAPTDANDQKYKGDDKVDPPLRKRRRIHAQPSLSTTAVMIASMSNRQLAFVSAGRLTRTVPVQSTVQALAVGYFVSGIGVEKQVVLGCADGTLHVMSTARQAVCWGRMEHAVTSLVPVRWGDGKELCDGVVCVGHFAGWQLWHKGVCIREEKEPEWVSAAAVCCQEHPLVSVDSHVHLLAMGFMSHSPRFYRLQR